MNLRCRIEFPTGAPKNGRLLGARTKGPDDQRASGTLPNPMRTQNFKRVRMFCLYDILDRIVRLFGGLFSCIRRLFGLLHEP